MRRCLTLALVAAGVFAPMSALAQNANCPPGAWFCEETEVAPAPAAPAPKQAAPAPAPEAKPEALPEPAPPPEAAPPPPRRGGVHVEAHGGASISIGGGTPPPVVVYQPLPSAPPPQVYIVTPQQRVLVRQVPPPPPRYYVRRSEWGLNLRLEGLMMGRKRAAENVGMGGVGLSLRYRPVPHFAIDFGVDLIGGKDYNGFDRAEIPISLSGLLYVNPRSRVQFYFMGGADWSHAKVHSDTASPLLANEFGGAGFSQEYSYFGGHGGIGLEFRLSHRVALNLDMLGFARSRTDHGRIPEFTDERGRSTNTSGGGLFRGGLTFWW